MSFQDHTLYISVGNGHVGFAKQIFFMQHLPDEAVSITTPGHTCVYLYEESIIQVIKFARTACANLRPPRLPYSSPVVLAPNTSILADNDASIHLWARYDLIYTSKRRLFGPRDRAAMYCRPGIDQAASSRITSKTGHTALVSSPDHGQDGTSRRQTKKPAQYVPGQQRWEGVCGCGMEDRHEWCPEKVCAGDSYNLQVTNGNVTTE